MFGSQSSMESDEDGQSYEDEWKKNSAGSAEYGGARRQIVITIFGPILVAVFVVTESLMM